MKDGLKGCKIYHRRTPDDVIRWLVLLGNSLNTEVTATTMIQVWRSTKDLELGWKRKKEAFGWTNQSIGQSKLDDKKFLYVCGIHKKRWAKYRHYEICAIECLLVEDARIV